MLASLTSAKKNTRWPGEAQDSNWAFGVSEVYLKRLVAHWISYYDWREHEAALNMNQNDLMV